MVQERFGDPVTITTGGVGSNCTCTVVVVVRLGSRLLARKSPDGGEVPLARAGLFYSRRPRAGQQVRRVRNPSRCRWIE